MFAFHVASHVCMVALYDFFHGLILWFYFMVTFHGYISWLHWRNFIVMLFCYCCISWLHFIITLLWSLFLTVLDYQD